MGPYDNELGQYIFDQSVMAASWYMTTDHELVILGGDNDGFDGYGPDVVLNEIFEKLHAGQMMTEIASQLNLSAVPDNIRSFDDDIGYFSF